MSPHHPHPATTPRPNPATLGKLRRWAAASIALALAGTAAACGSDANGASDGSQSEIEIVAFQAPSLGAFLPAVIEDQGLDEKQGLDLKFTYATPDNYNSEFGAGHYDVGGSAALLSEALRTERGSDVTYLFNLFDYYGTVVTSDPDIHELSDLPGHSLAAATGTTNYAMFQWFAKQKGVNLDKVHTTNQTTPGLSTMAQTGRADATQMWEPAYSTLKAEKPDIRTLDLDYEAWRSEFSTQDIPYLGVAAQTSWAEKHPKDVQAMYDTYKAAADWIQGNPQEAASIIAKTIPGGDPKVVQQLIEQNKKRLRMHVAPASDVSKGMSAVFKAGQQTGYLKKEPPESIVYKDLK